MKRSIVSLLIIIAAIFLFSSCSSVSGNAETHQKLNFAEIVFQTRLFEPLSENEVLYLEIVDEVTGIALNPTRFKMEAIGSAEYSIRLPLAIGSVIRYRYIRNGSGNTIEKDTQGRQILYRLYKVLGAAQIIDLVASWDQQIYLGDTGELSGYIFNEKTDVPLGEILVSINGLQTYTSHDGFYKFESVPLGEYSIVALHPDGLFEVFQQKAIIAQNSVTPASFGLIPSKMVKITFQVTAPEDTDPNAKIRMLGNTYQLGNSFSELSDGTGLLASISPVLTKNNNDAYSITLNLPSGLDLKYKYSLGDGFINAEHSADSSFRIRQLIVPEKDTLINDRIETWYSDGTGPVKFMITTPGNTPSGDSISIQFNPYAWMNPITMWKTGDDQWTYVLYGPFEYLNQSQYRFCRNGQCGIADDSITHGKNAMGYLLDLESGTPLTISYPIAQWFGLNTQSYSVESLVISETTSYIKGFEFETPLDRNWLPYLAKGLINAGVNGGNWVFFSPTWTFEADGSAGLSPRTDAFSKDVLSILDLSNEAGLNFALFPQMNSITEVNEYWTEADLSYNWWQRWFQNYRRFILNYVDLAAQNGINTIIIGGKSVSTAFSNGSLPNGSFSNTPYDFTEKWTELVNEIRSRYSGQIGFALPYSENLEQAPSFISNLDFIYLEMDDALTTSTSPAINEIQSRFANILDTEIYKLYAVFQKPVILGLNYHSIDGSASDCLNIKTSCESVYKNTQHEAWLIDVFEQADIYQAILREATARPWVFGIVSKGYNPAVEVEDGSASVHGKPAIRVLSSYFNQMK